MQRVFFMSMIIVISILMICITLNISFGTKKEAQNIKVSLIYNNETMIYEIEAYSTINDLLKFTGKEFEFDESKVNRNQILGHRDVIYLPEISLEKCVSINTGTLEELMTIKGIGEKAAYEIIEFRKANGNFNEIDDLILVKGIGSSKLFSIREKLCL